jgi:hypothetical protein
MHDQKARRARAFKPGVQRAFGEAEFSCGRELVLLSHGAISAIELSFGGSGCFSSESRYAVPRVSPAGKIVNFLRVNAREVSVLFTGRLRLKCPEVESHHGLVWERSCDRHRDTINLQEGLSPLAGVGQRASCSPQVD